MDFSDLGLDLGHGFTKYAYRDRSGRIQTGSFRSVASLHVDSVLATSMRRAQASASIKTVVVNGTKYDVDVDENSRVGKAFGERNEGNDFASRPEYLAVAGAAFAHLGATRISRLAIGLPIGTFQRDAESVQKSFSGMLNFGGHSVFVERTLVVPQPVGSLLTVVAKGDTSLVETTTCLIDIGHYTADWLVSQGFAIDYGRSGGRPGGASHIYRAMAEALSADLAEPFEGIDQIELTLRNRTPLLAFGQAVDIECYLQRGKMHAVETARAVRAKVRSAEDLTLVLTGGGGPLYRDALTTVFPKNRVVELEHGRFTNAIGFVLYAEQRKG
jgi:plasmid segregation protein ParM